MPIKIRSYLSDLQGISEGKITARELIPRTFVSWVIHLHCWKLPCKLKKKKKMPRFLLLHLLIGRAWNNIFIIFMLPIFFFSFSCVYLLSPQWLIMPSVLYKLNQEMWFGRLQKWIVLCEREADMCLPPTHPIDFSKNSSPEKHFSSVA